MTDATNVTQADRDAARQIFGGDIGEAAVELAAEIFSRHRATAEAASKAEIAELVEAVKALGRVLMPVSMTLAERECIGEPLQRDDVILSFMGSGASDRVTVGEFEDAMELATTTLAKHQTEGRG